MPEHLKNLRAAAIFALTTISMPALASPIHAVLYKNPSCSCCEVYASYLKNYGFDIELKPTNDLTQISAKFDVPADLMGCHTMLIDGYAFSGFVPADIVKKVLSEHPVISGVALPGMPTGSAGMPGVKTAPFTIYAFVKEGNAPTVYAVE